MDLKGKVFLYYPNGTLMQSFDAGSLINIYSSNSPWVAFMAPGDKECIMETDLPFIMELPPDSVNMPSAPPCSQSSGELFALGVRVREISFARSFRFSGINVFSNQDGSGIATTFHAIVRSNYGKVQL